MINNLQKSPEKNGLNSEILLELRDKLNLSTNDAEKSLVVRMWKQNLVNKEYKDVLDAAKELINTSSPYVKKTLIPILQESLQVGTLANLLDIIQREYASKLGKDPFAAKKNAIREKFKDLYNKGLLDNRLIFGLAVFLINNEDTKYNAGDLLEDIKKWLYTGSNIHGSFWNIVRGSNNTQTKQVQETGETHIVETLRSQSQ